MTDPICPAGLDLIKRFEGFRPSPYLCPAGVWTIGYGATRGLDGDRVTADHPDISEAEAERLLRGDAMRFAAAVDRLVKVPLDADQRGALISFAFNLGAGALQSSTLLRRINGMEWDDVPAQFARWVHGGGRILPGLVRRRQAETDLWVGARPLIASERASGFEAA